MANPVRGASQKTLARQAIVRALPEFMNQTFALAFGVTPSRVSSMRSDLGIGAGRQQRDPIRDADIEDLFRCGDTMDLIATKHCITRERVRQILVKRGVSTEVAKTMRTINRVKTKEMQRRRIWDERAEFIYGCSYELAKGLNGGAVFSAHRSKARMYVEQRRNSLRRGIDWKISFPDWCRIWDESGQWEQRGRGRYVMSRIGDSGPYKTGNVKIITSAQNASESYLVNPWKDRFAKREPVDPARMSARVAQVAELVQQGKTYTEIATLLGIHKRNAWQYVDQAKRKLAILEERAA